MTGTDGGAGLRVTAAQVDGYLAEDEVLLAARERAADVGATAITPGGGAALRFLAAVVGARAVVEVGTGAGVSGLWLLRGMAPDGVLTSIDVDPELQRGARTSFGEAGHGPSRLRLINGMGLDVLPRLTDGAYDLVFVDAVPDEYPRYVDEAVRLLRPGGVVALARVPGDGTTEAPGEAARQVRADERWVPALFPLGEGLLAAVRNP